MSRIVRGLSWGAAAAAALLIIAPAEAQAAYDSKSCEVAFTSCSTGSIPPHSTQHWVSIAVSTSFACGSDWAVYDTQNGNRVGNGHVGRDAEYSTTIYGLTDAYKLTLSNTCWDTDGVIANYT